MMPSKEEGGREVGFKTQIKRGGRELRGRVPEHYKELLMTLKNLKIIIIGIRNAKMGAGLFS
jgi:hypothetical protein